MCLIALHKTLLEYATRAVANWRNSMRKLILKNFGPIDACEISIDDFTILTGPQAAGKSTIAKAVAFFRTIKNDFCECMIRKQTTSTNTKLKRSITTQIRHKFLQLFGSSRAMDNDMQMKYFYDENTYVDVTLQFKEGFDYISPNFIYIDFSGDIDKFLNNAYRFESKESIVSALNELFNDEYETIFVPAGRNLITLLTDQLNYLFTMMDAEQRKSIDYCTQKYVERILRIRSSFNSGIEGYIASKGKNEYSPQIKKCIELSQEVIKGRYVFENGEEKLYLNGKNNRYVKINYTSSGQQEIVWLINILLYQLANASKSFVIIEEPEAHLYPDAQKIIAEIIAVFMGQNNSAFVTTHSPYILGAVNNMIYASKIAKKGPSVDIELIKTIIDKRMWIKKCAAFYVKKGAVIPCIEENGVLIKNEIIDGASEVINNDYDNLYNIEEASI